jgi:putative DNA-invertase from lambdoid prophage Rac
MSKKVVVYLRVSTAEQSTENQLPALQQWILDRGYELVRVYQEQESAWRAGHQKELARLVNDLSGKRVDILLVWSLDRLSRQGIARIFQLINQFKDHDVQVMSYSESWTEQSGPLADLLYAITGWMAQFEAKRQSERTRAGLARARAAGKVLGRPVGSKDRKKRRRRGYLLRYAK